MPSTQFFKSHRKDVEFSRTVAYQAARVFKLVREKGEVPRMTTQDQRAFAMTAQLHQRYAQCDYRHTGPEKDAEQLVCLWLVMTWHELNNLKPPEVTTKR